MPTHESRTGISQIRPRRPRLHGHHSLLLLLPSSPRRLPWSPRLPPPPFLPAPEKHIFVANLKASLESFFAARRLAKSALASLGPASEPCASVDKDQLGRLDAKLQCVRAALQDAERLAADQASESAELWQRELCGVECDVEDILEKVRFEALRASLVEDLGADDCSGTEPVKIRARDREVGALLSHLPLSSLGPKIKKIWEKYHEIASDREALRRRTGRFGCVPPRARRPLPSAPDFFKPLNDVVTKASAMTEGRRSDYFNHTRIVHMLKKACRWLSSIITRITRRRVELPLNPIVLISTVITIFLIATALLVVLKFLI